MLLDPEYVINNKIFTGKHKVCPNAIDFCIDRVLSISQENLITEHKKVLSGQQEIAPQKLDFKDDNIFGWKLKKGSYDVLSDAYVELPVGVCATLIVRSTLNRMGVFITSGLYDSGYKGHVGFVLHVMNDNPVFIEKGTRVGQIMFIKSEGRTSYEGGYNHEKGTHWKEK